MESATVRLLNAWMARKGLTSDHQAFQALGLSGQSAVTHWRKGRAQAAPHVIKRMAEEIGEDAGKWLVLVEAERATKAEDRKAWAAVARRFGAAATLAAVALIAQGFASTDALAATTRHPVSTTNASYVRLRDALRRIADAIKSGFSGWSSAARTEGAVACL